MLGRLILQIKNWICSLVLHYSGLLKGDILTIQAQLSINCYPGRNLAWVLCSGSLDDVIYNFFLQGVPLKIKKAGCHHNLHTNLIILYLTARLYIPHLIRWQYTANHYSVFKGHGKGTFVKSCYWSINSSKRNTDKGTADNRIALKI